MVTGKIFARSANYTAKLAGAPFAFALAVASIVIWLLTGPIFQYSDTWQLVMNTWTNVVCFLMVFLIQNSQNRDSAALQVNFVQAPRKMLLSALNISPRLKSRSFDTLSSSVQNLPSNNRRGSFRGKIGREIPSGLLLRADKGIE